MILVRVECGSQHGWGHLMRCVAIADEALELGVTTCFQVDGDARQAAALLAGRHRLLDIGTDAVRDARAINAQTIVLDGYGYGDLQEATYAECGLDVAVMDDFGHAPHRHARLIANGNLHYASPALYREAARAQLLLGPAYAPIRPLMRTVRRPLQAARPQPQRVLVVLGGSNFGGMLDFALDAVVSVLGSCAVVVAGKRPRALPARTWISKARSIEWVSEPDALASAMAQCDLAVSAGGMTSYELAYLGVPAVLVPATAAQAPVSAELARLGAAYVEAPGPDLTRRLMRSLEALSEDCERRTAMAAAGRAIFDALGAQRIASALIGLARAH
ncbi:glycosyltransferase [Ramlibacter tataouinensis]|uniref:PseG/SpsG family protein n=1 Tax=Ramlibacter tataouinensis TaxID=94132 RepID=UPI0022F3C78B|nr:glycosyltransferase [Ramlibacter tataouinensis]WBY00903.1 glycosyltransferase [Ramlibacter tataouinensis]